MKNITNELADVFLKNNIDAVAGNLVCSTCCIKAMKMENTSIESSDHSVSSDELSILSSSFCRSKAIEEASTQISDNFPAVLLNTAKNHIKQQRTKNTAKNDNGL